MLVLPTDKQPAFSRFSIAVAVYGGTKLESIFEPQVVKISFVQNRSFCAIGMPSSEEKASFESSSFAALYEPSLLRVTNAFRSLCSSIN